MVVVDESLELEFCLRRMLKLAFTAARRSGAQVKRETAYNPKIPADSAGFCSNRECIDLSVVMIYHQEEEQNCTSTLSYLPVHDTFDLLSN